MHTIKESYVVSQSGKRLGVFLNIADFRKLLAQAEMAESIKAYDSAKESGDEAVPFVRAVAELRRKKRK